MNELHLTYPAGVDKAAARVPTLLDFNPSTPLHTRGYGSGAPTGFRNWLLAGLDSARAHSLRRHMTRVRLKRGTVLSEVGSTVKDVYFPEDCIVAVVVPMRSGACPEACLIGLDGMTDCAAGLGNMAITARSLVLVPGDAIRLPVSAVGEAMDHCPEFRHAVQFYCGRLLAQSVQSAGCHALHPAQARLARLLLTLSERLPPGAPMPLTQETLASMLGVQRTTVSTAADNLQRNGMIATRRGMVVIRNAAKLAQAACECHAVTRLEQREH